MPYRYSKVKKIARITIHTAKRRFTGELQMKTQKDMFFLKSSSDAHETEYTKPIKAFTRQGRGYKR